MRIGGAGRSSLSFVAGMSNRQVGDFINAHKRLENPHGSQLGPDYKGAERAYLVHCPPNLHEICLECWNHEVRSWL